MTQETPAPLAQWSENPLTPAERTKLRAERHNTNYQALRRNDRAEIWYFDNNSGREVLIAVAIESYFERMVYVAQMWNGFIEQTQSREAKE